MSKNIFLFSILLITLIIFMKLTVAFGHYSIFFNLSIVSVLMIAIIQVYAHGLFSPSTIVLFTALPYFLTSIFNYNLFRSINYNFVDSSISLVVFSFFFFVSFLIFNQAIKSIKIKKIEFREKTNSYFILFVYFLFLIIYVVLVDQLFSLKIGSITRADIYKSKPVFFDLYKIFMYSFSIFYGWYVFCVKTYKSKFLLIWFLPFIILVSVDILILGDRRLAVLLILIYTFMLNTKTKISPFYIIFGSFFAVFLWIYSYLRNTSIDQWSNIIHDLDYSVVFSPDKSEFGAFSIIWNDYFSKYSSVQMHPTYLETFVQLIPGFIYSDRPIPPSVSFVKEFYPDIYNVGGGLAFNAILESMMNFNIFGPIVLALILVFFSKFYNKNQLGVLLGAIYIFCFSFTMRNDMISNLRTFLIVGIVISVCVLIFCKIKNPRNKEV